MRLFSEVNASSRADSINIYVLKEIDGFVKDMPQSAYREKISVPYRRTIRLLDAPGGPFRPEA